MEWGKYVSSWGRLSYACSEQGVRVPSRAVFQPRGNRGPRPEPPLTPLSLHLLGWPMCMRCGPSAFTHRRFAFCRCSNLHWPWCTCKMCDSLLIGYRFFIKIPGWQTWEIWCRSWSSSARIIYRNNRPFQSGWNYAVDIKQISCPDLKQSDMRMTQSGPQSRFCYPITMALLTEEARALCDTMLD